jgi:hypothetical protein
MMLVFVEYIECVENAHRMRYVRCRGPETTPGEKQRGVVSLESVRTRHRVRANSFPATRRSSCLKRALDSSASKRAVVTVMTRSLTVSTLGVLCSSRARRSNKDELCLLRVAGRTNASCLNSVLLLPFMFSFLHSCAERDRHSGHVGLEPPGF